MQTPTIFKSDKILHHLDQVNDWIKGDNVFAILVELDATNICNHKCPGCFGFMADGVDNSYLLLEEMKRLIVEIIDLGAKSIMFSGGGEPLCNPGTVEAIKFANRNGLDVGLVTNGSLIHKYSMESLVNDCMWIRVSLDSGSSIMHKKTHGTDDFDTVVKNIKLLVEAKNKIKSDCTIGVAYLTGKNTDSHKDMIDFVDLCVKLKVDYAQFRPYSAQGKNNLSKHSNIDFDIFKSMSNDKTEVMISEHKYNHIASGRDINYSVCYGHQFATVICANGDMTICCHTRGIKPMSIGSIKDSSIQEIWESSLRKKVVESIDLNFCPLYCRGNTFNEILFSLKEDRRHVNFL